MDPARMRMRRAGRQGALIRRADAGTGAGVKVGCSWWCCCVGQAAGKVGGATGGAAGVG